MQGQCQRDALAARRRLLLPFSQAKAIKRAASTARLILLVGSYFMKNQMISDLDKKSFRKIKIVDLNSLTVSEKINTIGRNRVEIPGCHFQSANSTLSGIDVHSKSARQ